MANLCGTLTTTRSHSVSQLDYFQTTNEVALQDVFLKKQPRLAFLT